MSKSLKIGFHVLLIFGILVVGLIKSKADSPAARTPSAARQTLATQAVALDILYIERGSYTSAYGIEQVRQFRIAHRLLSRSSPRFSGKVIMLGNMDVHAASRFGAEWGTLLYSFEEQSGKCEGSFGGPVEPKHTQLLIFLRCSQGDVLGAVGTAIDGNFTFYWILKAPQDKSFEVV